jgi:tetratricopeptide (TPR) repeat protein
VLRRVLSFAIAASALATAARAANWTEYRSGPFRVYSNAGDRDARQRLNEMEQIRWMLGALLKGTPARDTQLTTVWPIDLVLFDKTREYGPYALPQPFVEGGSAILSASSAETPLPMDWRRDLARRLIEDNAGRMPDSIETALADLFSTVQVSATRITLGTPPPAGVLSGERLKAWTKLQYLATNPELAGRLRIFLNNLQQGSDEDTASRNAFNMPAGELNQRVEAYGRAGNFAAYEVTGMALNPNRDFIEKRVADIAPLLEELKAQGKTFPPDSPRGELAKNTQASLQLAAAANPKWGEPHFKLAALETNPLARIQELKTAATLDPRNSAYWQELARAQMSAEQYDDAAKSWAAAERSAPNDGERLRIRQTRLEMEQRRAEFDLEQRRRLALEREQELQRLKDAAAAEVHAAEEAANRELGGLKSTQAPLEWWNDADGTPVDGTLTKVDCLASSLRLTIKKSVGGNAVLLIRDPQQLTVKGEGVAEFGCGLQRPPRKIRVLHDGKADAKLGTAGDIHVVEFPQ